MIHFYWFWMVDSVTVQQSRDNLLTYEGVMQLLFTLCLSTTTTAAKWQSVQVTWSWVWALVVSRSFVSYLQKKPLSCLTKQCSVLQGIFKYFGKKCKVVASPSEEQEGEITWQQQGGCYYTSGDVWAAWVQLSIPGWQMGRQGQGARNQEL